ncbi:response regulator [Nocardioides sp. GY 10127]|uniref:response regulator n=1 Tax=Nocardioides sp. GY 10127 TaxID=2569762 RepID=UPI0014580F17|nr:response regulator [Nocardioides sp. GY 10127]
MRVLVVDDDPDLVLLMSLFLRRQGGHEVVTAGDGLEALTVLAEEPVDAVVLDWSMPRLDGLGLCARIREDERLAHLPLVMVTAMPDHEPALAAGIDTVIRKPFDSATLLSAVASVADSSVA